ncbi:MAG: methyltransferase domain-containing protein [Thermoplasmatota archaeon]
MEWDAGRYAALADPQFRWGMEVLATTPVQGLVLDAGCGTGALAAQLARRGRVVALDVSKAMVGAAGGALGGRADCVLATLTALPFRDSFDLIFSNAVFHWVLDQERLYRELFAALAPGGRLRAQCGGKGNLDALHGRVRQLQKEAPFARYAVGEPWVFPAPQAAHRNLVGAGFTSVRTWREEKPTTFRDAGTYTAFLAAIVLRHQVAALPALLKDSFLGRLARLAEADDPPFTLDYVRLNVDALRPA